LRRGPDRKAITPCFHKPDYTTTQTKRMSLDTTVTPTSQARKSSSREARMTADSGPKTDSSSRTPTTEQKPPLSRSLSRSLWKKIGIEIPCHRAAAPAHGGISLMTLRPLWPSICHAEAALVNGAKRTQTAATFYGSNIVWNWSVRTSTSPTFPLLPGPGSGNEPTERERAR